MRRASGSILLSVLGFALILLIFAFLVAGRSMMDLGFAGHVRQDVRCEQLARAAVSQFLSEAARAPDTPGYWLSRFQNHVFPDGGQRLQGQAQITFDPTQPNYSVDNSMQELPALSYFDRGSSRKSVPPFGMSLVIRADVGGQPLVYEAVLQRRWPYVLTTPANVKLSTSGQPSLMEGNLLRLAGPAGMAPDVLTLPSKLYNRAYASRPNWPSNTYGVGVGAGSSWAGHLRGVSGGPSPLVVLGPGLWTGRIGSGLAPKKLEEMLAFPSPDAFAEIIPSPGPNYALPIGSLMKIYNKDGSFNHILTLSRLTLADGDFCLNGTTTNSPEEHMDEDNFKTAGITLTNARLYVKGNLELRDRTNSSGDDQPAGLQGQNATLIVDGDLILDGGDLDAGDQGLVIMCRNLFLGASGTFRGLLLVQNSAFIAQDQTSPKALKIQGAIVCGRGKTTFKEEPDPGAVWEPGRLAETFVYDGLGLSGTELTYNASYCRGILRYGEWQLMSLHKVL